MGGRVLEHEAKRLRNEGIAIGEKRGIAIGEKRGISIGLRQANFNNAMGMRKIGMTDEQIIQVTGLTPEDLATFN